MSVDIYPPIAAAELKLAIQDTQRRELTWLLDDLQATLGEFRHGLEDCYALLAPIDPGSTLVVSTPRNESVKGHVTRVGTRIVKGTLSLRLRTAPPQTLSIDPTHPIHLAPLTLLHARLTDALDVLTRTLEFLPEGGGSKTTLPPAADATAAAAFVSAQLRLLSTTLHESSAILKGRPLTDTDPGWTTLSAAPGHFLAPPAPPPPTSNLNNFLSAPQQQTDASAANPLHNISIYFSLQESALVLWVRSLEPADAAPSFGMKFALAIGTARRLEHDESDVIFGYCCAGLDGKPAGGEEEHRRHGPRTSPTLSVKRPVSQSGPPVLSGTRDSTRRSSSRNPGGAAGGREKDGDAVQVYVREKIRVESADPSLMSLSAKLGALSHTLTMARRNLAAVMGEELEE
ncbi:hypothetical protein MGG_02604 [Pyricularia oryzae 70-15]|uniref:37S ribosomal protein Rsm22 n=3 Tax=Pyricularia oryzae TaxID=318829 RepID=G5EI43_PYRO7|nr:uncharacterized protein MGG_02604 [Pyricularia oryzae 70-15]ELQ36354.1 hypothetical protein OOU_Y34scaffold00666g215 [Pyricularia oryzae Y34]KAI7929925.1 hypothetical protein M9X92_001043 [Pyricularia oryzae]EAQ70916.1 hypothetical protein MGCH7_ch7g323 [Pyricularia oryzae 70-15]EHA46449.1 hypothetical protein MGG_02604 [Pyricularia oryzae 70-15]KAI7930515.1 hypothetical protein M0657_001635 [Pyricularia oryzae]